MLDQRRKRLAKVAQMLYKCVVFPGLYTNKTLSEC